MQENSCAIRAVLGLANIGIAVANKSWWGIVGVVPLATAAIGWCPRYGRGFSLPHLKRMRQFFQVYAAYPNRAPAFGDNDIQQISSAVRSQLPRSTQPQFQQALGWTHYRLLMTVPDPTARSFYEIEAAREGQEVATPENVVKDPLVLEFLGPPDRPHWHERDLEQAIIDHLQEVMLELGKGFSFVARQKRITLDGDHFFVDLVLYNRLLRCFVLIDLKLGKLTHRDLGQLQMADVRELVRPHPARSPRGTDRRYRVVFTEERRGGAHDAARGREADRRGAVRSIVGG